jgi:hypothetical protein
VPEAGKAAWFGRLVCAKLLCPHFADFFDEHRVEIDAKRYRARGTSNANRMRTHWELDANHAVGRVIGGRIDYEARANKAAQSINRRIATSAYRGGFSGAGKIVR